MVAVRKYKKVLLLGDSQTGWSGTVQYGWTNLLMEKHVGYMDIINRGRSGYNTNCLLENMVDMVPTVPAHQYDMAVVWFGTNDAVNEDQPQHLPTSEYTKNLNEIVTRLVDMGIEADNILILTPATVDETKWEGTLTNENMRKYGELALDVARERQCQSADLFTIFSEYEGDDLFMDGLHLDKKGSELVFGEVEKFVSERLNPTAPAPTWRECLGVS